MFEKTWGALPGDVSAEAFWHPGLGHFFHLRPSDIPDMTPAQLQECAKWLDKLKRGSRG